MDTNPRSGEGVGETGKMTDAAAVKIADTAGKFSESKHENVENPKIQGI